MEEAQSQVKPLLVGVAGGAVLMTLFDGGLTFLISAGLAGATAMAYAGTVAQTIPAELDESQADWAKCQIGLASALVGLAVFLSPIFGLIGSVALGAIQSYFLRQSKMPQVEPVETV